MNHLTMSAPPPTSIAAPPTVTIPDVCPKRADALRHAFVRGLCIFCYTSPASKTTQAS